MPPRNYKKKFAEALENNDETTIRYLLEEGLVIYNQPLDIEPQYPLSFAAYYGSLAGINILLSYGALINYEEDESVEVYTPLMWAARSQYTNAEVLLTLLDYGGKYASHDINRFVEDIFRYHLKDARPILYYLLNNNLIDINDVITIIMEQFYRSPVPYFEVLFSITCDPNVMDEEYGETLLFEFMGPPRSSDDLLSNRIETIKGLIALGINPNHKNKAGFTAAEYATSPKLASAISVAIYKK